MKDKKQVESISKSYLQGRLGIDEAAFEVCSEFGTLEGVEFDIDRGLKFRYKDHGIPAVLRIPSDRKSSKGLGDLALLVQLMYQSAFDSAVRLDYRTGKEASTKHHRPGVQKRLDKILGKVGPRLDRYISGLQQGVAA